MDRETLENVVEEFDGIPGWLTLFGNEYTKWNRDLRRIKELAVNLALEELSNIINKRVGGML